jgi:hypothetical protein
MDLWLDFVPPPRLVATCWCPEDIAEATARTVTPLVVMRDLQSVDQALAFVTELPAGSFVYSHPAHGPQTFDVALARRIPPDRMPGGGKFTMDDIADIRAEVAHASASGTHHPVTSLTACNRERPESWLLRCRSFLTRSLQ